MRISYMFRFLCTNMRENNYVSSLETNYYYDIVICGFNSVALM